MLWVVTRQQVVTGLLVTTQVTTIGYHPQKAEKPRVPGSSAAQDGRGVVVTLGGSPDFSAVSSELTRRGPPHTESAREDPSVSLWFPANIRRVRYREIRDIC